MILNGQQSNPSPPRTLLKVGVILRLKSRVLQEPTRHPRRSRPAIRAVLGFCSGSIIFATGDVFAVDGLFFPSFPLNPRLQATL